MFKKIDANLIYNALYQLLLILVPILTTPYLARTLGPNSLGIYGYVAAIAAFLGNFMLLGLNQFGVRTIAKSNSSNLIANFRDLWGTQIIVGIILLGAYLLFVILFAPYKIFFLLEIPFLIGYGTDISWLYIGVGKVKRVVVRNSIVKLISVVFIFIFIRDQSDLWKYFLINSLGILLANMIFLIDINQIGIRIRQIHWKKYRSRFLSSLLFLAIPLVASQLYTNIDSALVGTFAGTHQLAFYDQSQKIARVILAALTSTSTVIMPKMAALDGHSDQSRLNKMFRLSLDVTLVVSLIFALLMMVNTNNFIPFFFGSSFVPMRQNMYWVSLIVIFIAYGSVFSLQLALAKGLYRIYMIPYVVGALYSLFANTLFDTKYGAMGGTLVIVTTELIVCVLRIYMIRDYIDLGEILRSHYKMVLAFVITLFVFKIVNFDGFNLYLSFVLNSIGALLCFVIMMLIIHDKTMAHLLYLLKI
ncbi:oligosaccharide flippase family protein [Lactiplantibacillus plantarum]|uniref:oligosaccharide flippase family protein n=1 Tax=Lactiplantibacillus plantarum TaxID=1590 RepID=UPI0021A2B490|nr:oligosaccharide flippase family protein [Lactiplantibacillus plantarum]